MICIFFNSLSDDLFVVDDFHSVLIITFSTWNDRKGGQTEFEGHITNR